MGSPFRLRGWTRVALLCALAAGLMAAQGVWSQSAGRINTTQRLVWLQKPNGMISPAARGTTFESGDIISTGRDSSAQLTFSDGGELTLRPDTQLRIEQYRYVAESPQTDTALLRLLKGGMRAVTGLVGKRGNPDAYRVGAATATIGIRGTDFIARICGDDCAQESRKFPPTERTPVPVPTARLVLAQGRITATDAQGAVRELEHHSAVYEGDIVRTAPAGYAILVFRDEGRMTLSGNTTLAIEKFRYEQVRPEQNSVALRLLQGGLRSLTGLIAKRRPESYRISTVIATIGVRGTGLDIVCLAPCADDKAAGIVGGGGDSDLNTAGNSPAGLVVQAWSGTGVLSLLSGAGQPLDIDSGQTLVLNDRDAKPEFLPGPAPILFEERVPRPDRIEIDLKELFASAPDNPGQGPIVYVTQGRVTLTDGGKSLIIEQGEAGQSNGNGGDPVRVRPLATILYDPWLRNTSNICR